ncbi:MAG: 3-isopropylmalate dehydratase small subunit [Flavobacteriales bacterium]|nr:3-isopropylmalate dehydratase small subunit [Flavobacteriales bacterium]
MKEKFTTLTSTMMPIEVENVDTDQIIPARFLKATTRDGFGKNLFYDWRYTQHGSPIPSFAMNNSCFSGAKVLLSGKNFGCGSSREHAAWAIFGAGYRAVISSFFADIFKNNAINNGLLPVQVSPEFLSKAFSEVKKDPKTPIVISLEEQTVSLPSVRLAEHFEINPYKKECMINGYDDIDYLIAMRGEIQQYENDRMK